MKVIFHERSVRIVGGEFGGVSLYLPNKNGIRPTPDRVKEAVFNILDDRIVDARFLDLYAGSGAVGLEALSRGAVHVTMVELEYIEVIRKNTVRCGITTNERFKVIRGPIWRALKAMRKRDDRFDLIYADPPWHIKGEGENVLRALDLLNPGGIMMLELFRKIAPPEADSGFELYDSRKYGDTKIYFYRHQG